MDALGNLTGSQDDFKDFIGMSTTEWKRWVKPAWAKFIFFQVIWWGGGGAGWFSGASGGNRWGSGGGSSGAASRVMMPASLVPDLLLYRVGLGGAGGVASTLGSHGGSSLIATDTTLGSSSMFLQANGWNRWNVGTASAAWSAGTAPSALSLNNMTLASIGIPAFQWGVAGWAGWAHTGAAGASVFALQSGVVVMGGAGWGGTPAANTNFSWWNAGVASPLPFITASGSGASGWATPGGDWMTSWRPFVSLGGAGGGSNGTGTGGAGGKGGIGSGGGGGGAGVTWWAGWKWGDGLVQITVIF